MSAESHRIREIPYNYTSFSDHEIVLRFLGEEAWGLINQLRTSRQTGRSARMLFEVLGDLWVISRNPFIQDDMLQNPKRNAALIGAMRHRIEQIQRRSDDNQQAIALAGKATKAIDEFSQGLESQRQLRKQLKAKLSGATRRCNVDFSGQARVAHVTDATDWRVEFPLAVISPDNEQEVEAIVAACIKLGLTVIPRGGGTGYTGGAVPLYADSVVINTEKLIHVASVKTQQLPGTDSEYATIAVEAGVVTRRVSEAASKSGLVFAVDPTSQDASTIGGNISMNAGGKKAVLWGTTLDNLVSWKMVVASGEWLEVTRLHHNMGKIHDQAEVTFACQRYQADAKTTIGDATYLVMPGQSFRKVGLGKDVTDKFLGGLPGIQKEGCDGIITSAVFILHRMPNFKRTVCLEFFGADLGRAVPAIVEVKNNIDETEGVVLSGLEHLDERYVRAVNYTTKAARSERPKMVLLADIVGDEENDVATAASNVVRLANARGAEGFIAVSSSARKQFWLDRARTAAIAAHTNAFKINEDVVIPLDKLTEYSAGIEEINIKLSIKNKLSMIEALKQYFSTVKELTAHDVAGHSDEQNSIEIAKREAVISLLNRIEARWLFILEHLTSPANELEGDGLSSDIRILRAILEQQLVISFHREVATPLRDILAGLEYEASRLEITNIHQRILSGRLFVATHMHAGDGNVHTNIPVNSNDYNMMHAAELVVDEIMVLATGLGGVVSGEHGIGLTKIRYLDDDIKKHFAEYKTRVDPNGVFNRGKLMPGSGLDNAYTPSLRLLEQEALILEASDLGALNEEIKNCLRCGKCKPVCTTHVPQANLLYSPRNKILAAGLLIEAFLYEEQTRRGISLNHFAEMNDVADHCTVCHRCLAPCPVNIDFGDVTVMMRQILNDSGKRKSKAVTKMAMAFLNVTDPTTIKLMRKSVIQMGYWGQRLGHKWAKSLGMVRSKRIPKSTTGKPILKEQVVRFLDKPLPNNVPSKTMRAMLGAEDNKMIPIIRKPDANREESDAVFYFPGCGSERLFSQVGMATLAMLYEVGAQTVLPPGYLCCGYPQTSSGDEVKGRKITTDNRVLFHRVANTLNYMDIKTVIVSCGTCMDQLLKYEFENIFPGCRLLDIHEYLFEKGLTLPDKGQKYLYHEPCHTPMKQYSSIKVAETLLSAEVKMSDRCCGEAGTFSVSRPDIAAQVRYRKEHELKSNLLEFDETPAKILTSCPACQQGLSRYESATALETDYIVVEMVKQHLGDEWSKAFTHQVLNGGMENILL
ncbi:MAG: DUF3683 domain-containing protein [Methylococcales bacterium]|jgi:FAD/FMN-containing dehydrogenase/Fe-S oxidoreductase|nr:DUF3683 domain-containing protein [Methylococcales bacterium]